MSKKQDPSEFIGKKFNSLFIIEDLGNPNGDDRTVLAKCVCGKIKSYLLLNIKKGKSKCCGCIRNNHYTHNLSNHPLYYIRSSMIDRCYNKNSRAYKYYGGKGVTVCDEWRTDFKNFYDWAMSEGWKKGLEVDKDIKGDGLLYSPETCSLVTDKQNSNKRSSNKYLTHNGITKTIAQWADDSGVGHVLYNRLNRQDWSVERSLTAPKQKNKYA